MKILILCTSTERESSILLAKTASELGIPTLVASYDQVVWKFQDGETILTIAGAQLDEFGCVYIYSEGNYLETITLISECCRGKNIPFFDTAFTYQKPWIDTKAFEYLKLSKEKLPIIPSIYVSHKNFGEYIDQLTFPLIAKRTHLSRGEGVFLCSNLLELTTLFASYEQLLLQPFLKNQGDVRILIIGSTIVGSMLRKASEGEYKNNISQGGTAEPFVADEYLQNLALNSAAVLNYQFAGVDCIKDATGEWKVMEVNRAPQFPGFMRATGIDVPKILLKYLQQQIIKSN